jgi:hypothetical protein
MYACMHAWKHVCDHSNVKTGKVGFCIGMEKLQEISSSLKTLKTLNPKHQKPVD